MQRKASFLIMGLMTILVFGGCLDPTKKKDLIINNVIKGGMSSRAQVMRDGKGIIEDYKVYQDGKNYGVIFEYIYKAGVQVDASQLSPANVKKTMMPRLRQDKDSKMVFAGGFYMKIIYKKSNGEVVSTTTLTEADL